MDTTLSACNSTNGRDAQSHSAGPTCSSGIGLRWHYWLPAASNHNSWLRPSPWHSRHDSSSRSCLHHTCNSAHPTEGSPIRPWFNVGISAHKAIASRVLGFHKGIAFRDLLSGIANLQSEDHHLVRYHLAGQVFEAMYDRSRSQALRAFVMYLR